MEALLGYAQTSLHGENLESDLWWLDPVMAALERRSLPEGVAIEEPRCRCGVKRWLLCIWSLL